MHVYTPARTVQTPGAARAIRARAAAGACDHRRRLPDPLRPAGARARRARRPANLGHALTDFGPLEGISYQSAEFLPVVSNNSRLVVAAEFRRARAVVGEAPRCRAG